MFVEYLTRKQQGVLLHYAEQIMMVDGSTHPRESDHLQGLQRQVESGVIPEAVEIQDLTKLFGDRRSRVAFFIEVTCMGYVDEDFDPDESRFLHEIAKALMIEDEMPVFRSWISRQLLLLKEADLLMED